MVTWQSVVSLVTDLGAMGFILYLAHRLTTHTIPRLAEQFASASERQRADFRESLAQQRADFERWQVHDHEAHQRAMTQLAEAVRELAREIKG